MDRGWTGVVFAPKNTKKSSKKVSSAKPLHQKRLQQENKHTEKKVKKHGLPTIVVRSLTIVAFF